MELSEDTSALRHHVTVKERLRHLTWAWFTFPMSTGGLALLLAVTPHRFDGLTTIGKVVFVFDLVCITTLCCAISTRFFMEPRLLPASLSHPTESLFFPTVWLAVSNTINCMEKYGVPSTGPWLVDVLRVLFWLYVAITFTLAVVQYWFLFKSPPERLTIQSMTPAWILPVFPVMLSGTLASTLSASQPAAQRMTILIGGLACQGLGWMVALIIYAAYIYRLILYGLPEPNLRPGMFIAVGPPSFTGLAIIGMSLNIPRDYGYFADHPTATDTLQTMALFSAIFLWMLSAWFFSFSLLSVLEGLRKMSFRLLWWGFVFPNVGFTITTISIGTSLKSEGILWVATAMTIIIVVVYLLVLAFNIKAVLTNQILMPGLDEDAPWYHPESYPAKEHDC